MQRRKPKSPLVTRRIKAGMAELEYRPRDMAKLFKVTERTWDNWMAEPEKYLQLGRLQVIAAKLQTSVGHLVEE